MGAPGLWCSAWPDAEEADIGESRPLGNVQSVDAAMLGRKAASRLSQLDVGASFQSG
jgi:hypothetical protein